MTISPQSQALYQALLGSPKPLSAKQLASKLHIDDYILFADDAVLKAYKTLQTGEQQVHHALNVPNYSHLPQVLLDTYGNSTCGNIAAASRFTGRGEQVVAMAYDSRENY